MGNWWWEVRDGKLVLMGKRSVPIRTSCDSVARRIGLSDIFLVSLSYHTVVLSVYAFNQLLWALTFLSSAVNPIIYGLVNTNLRSTFRPSPNYTFAAKWLYDCSTVGPVDNPTETVNGGIQHQLCRFSQMRSVIGSSSTLFFQWNSYYVYCSKNLM